MDVSSLSDLTFISSGTASKRSSGGMDVSSDTFLQLLVAQLKYQDPLEPQTDTDFVAQLAQLSSLEQLQSMNESLSVSQASSFIGKTIYAEVLNPDTGVTESYRGIVESILMKSGKAYCVMGDLAISVDDIAIVSDTTDNSNNTASTSVKAEDSDVQTSKDAETGKDATVSTDAEGGTEALPVEDTENQTAADAKTED